MAETRPPAVPTSQIRLKKGCLGTITILGEKIPLPPEDTIITVEWITPPAAPLPPETISFPPASKS